MKRIVTIALAALSIIAVAGCTKEKPVDSLTVNSSAISFTNDGGSQAVSFTTNADWTAKADQSWITLSAEAGTAGNATLTITVAANTEYATRSGKVTVTAGTVQTVFNVSQTEPKVFEAGAPCKVSAAAQQIVLRVNTNEGYSVNVEDAAKSWITVGGGTKAAPVASDVTLNIAANTNLQSRTGVVTVKTPSNSFDFTITQASDFNETELASAQFLGKAMKVYDAENWEYLEYEEFFISLKSADETVGIAINVAEGTDPTVFPVGEFTVASDFSHTPGTLTTKSEEECYYTTIYSGEDEKLVVDGNVTISKEGDVYSVVAAFMDENENIKKFSYVGEIAVEDNSLFCSVQSLTYDGQYDTYFTPDQAKKTSFTFCMSAPLAEGAPDLSYFTMTLWREKTAENLSLPLGTFTLAAEPEALESPYKNGNIPQVPGTFQWSANDRDYVGTEMNEGGTFTVSGDASGYSVTIKGEIRTVEDIYDEDYNFVETKYGDWIAVDKTVPVVVMPEVSDNESVVAEDGDIVITGSMGGQQQTLYYGNYWETGDIYTVSVPYANYVHTIYLTIQTDSAVEFDRTKPWPTGTYTFAETPVAGQKQLLPAWTCNKTSLKKTTRYFTVTNTYTGTVFAINGGNIEWDGTNISFDITAKGVSGAGEGKEIKVTGSTPAVFMAATNWSDHAKYKLGLDSESNPIIDRWAATK